MPLLTIITVVRNNVDGLSATLRSVLAQSCKDWEMIIKDGNSSDGTLLVAREAGRNPNITVLEGEDGGIYDAMNAAISVARGKYLLMLNGGDILANEYALDKCLALMQSGGNLDIGFFTTVVRLENGRSYYRYAKPPRYIHYGQPAIHQSTLYCTELHRKHLYLPTYPICADYVSTALQMKEGARAASFNEVLSSFEIISTSRSYQNQRDARREFASAIKELWKLPWWRRTLYKIRRYGANKGIQLAMKQPKIVDWLKAAMLWRLP